MLCIYFQIPYERQLVRIAPVEIETILTNISEVAESNGAVPFKVPCASIYQFKNTAVAPVFSANLFLKFLSATVSKERKRLTDYRVIIDVCNEDDTADVIAEHFLSYQNILIPNRGFFASAQAEHVLKPYINFTYIPKYRLYHCMNFIVPKLSADAAEHTPCEIYMPDNVAWFHSVYHFMLLNPLSDTEIEANLSEKEKKQYNEIKNVRHYFRRHRFIDTFPDYFVDAFILNTEYYFRSFMKRYKAGKLTIYATEHTEGIQQLMHIIPSACVEKKFQKIQNITTLPNDFAQLTYLVLYASQFIFEDELQDFFSSIHKGRLFISNLYEWMYAFGIIEVKNNIYSTTPSILFMLEQQIGNKKSELHAIIATFLWQKYKAGALCPDKYLSNVFSMLGFKPDEHFTLHSFFYENSDKEIRQIDITPFKSEYFFTALESYQKALRLSEQKHIAEVIYAVKNALTAVQKCLCIAGEYRALTFIALLHLSQNKIEDAITYFHYALENAELLHDTRFICETLFNLSISYFLQNNLTGAIHHLDCLQQAVTDYFEQQQKIPGIFMQGRTALQAGDYTKAEYFFEEAANLTAPYFMDWEPLCKIWYARTLAQKGQIGKAQQLLWLYKNDSPDASVFLIESFLLNPVMRNELQDADTALLNIKPYEPYQSGFALAEELVWGTLYETSALHIFYTSLESYYRFRLASASVTSEDTEKQYLQTLEQNAREALRYRDIYASLYLYLCYDAFLRLEGQTSDNANGYLSRSFKALQNTMGNITDNTVRDKFIFRNVWNAKLYAAAQKNKLI